MRDFLLARVMWPPATRLNWNCTKQWPWPKITSSSCNSFKCLFSAHRSISTRWSGLHKWQVQVEEELASDSQRHSGLPGDTFLKFHHQNLTCSPYLALLKSPGKCRRGSLEMMERRQLRNYLIEPPPTLAVNNMEVKHNVSHMRPVADKYWRPPVALDCHFKTR